MAADEDPPPRAAPPTSTPRLVISETVRFRDVDPSGHLNNALVATFFEQARLELFGPSAPFVLARLEVDYRARTFMGERVEVRTRVADLGRRSVRLHHAMSVRDDVRATGVSVLAALSPDRTVTVELPRVWRSYLERAAATEAGTFSTD